MARRRLTIKRLDPWSVLKFGAVANVVLFLIFMLVAAVVWYIIDRLQIIDQVCQIALDVGFASCGVDAGNLFQALALLGGMWIIVQTAVLVFFAFLHNLIADLTGGLVIGTIEDGPGTQATAATSRPVTTSAAPAGGPARPARDPATAEGVTRGSTPSGPRDQADQSLFEGR